MNGLAILVVTATLGVDYGWKYADDGKLEYLIQIEPALIRSMENGLPITSEIEPEVRGLVRRLRVIVGSGPLPRDAIRPAAARQAVSAEQPASAEVPLRPGDGANGLAQPRLPGNDHLSRDAARGNGEPYRFDLGSAPIEQAAAKPADSPSDIPAGDAKNESTQNDSAASNEASPATDSPWFVAAIVALCASLGINFYQGWNLKSARRRYYQLVDRLGLRSNASSDGISIEGYGK
ncbi:MAG: hypothetical protein WD875_05645 [Pirellulales bacterium]